MRRVFPIFLAACGSASDRDPVTDKSVDTDAIEAALTLTVGPAFVGLPVDFEVQGIEAGVSTVLAVSTTPDADGCHEGSSGICWDLMQPVETAPLPESGGVATFTVTLPKGTAGTLYVQAVAADSRSDVVPFEVVGAKVDSDGDLVPDVVEHYLGMDPHSTDSDGDGIDDARDLYPTTANDPDDFVVDDREVVPASVGMVDPEFSADGQMVWQSFTGSEAWVATVDATTGAILPSDGRGRSLGGGLPTMRKYKNGPEWLEADDGLHVVFTQTNPGMPDTLMQATSDGDTWSAWPIEPIVLGGGVFGSQDLGDPNPRIAWLGPRGFAGGKVRWRDLGGQGAGVEMPVGVAFGHWMTGARAYVGPVEDAQGVTQAAIYHVDDDRIEFVTDTPLDVSDAYGWVDGTTRHCALFRRPIVGADMLEVWTDTGSGWQVTHTAPLPQGWPQGYSIEPFAWNGQTWLTYMASNTDDPVHGLIYIAGTTAEQATVRRVSDETVATRRDPEAVTHGQDAWIFYSRFDHADRAIHRTALGLGTRIAQDDAP